MRQRDPRERRGLARLHRGQPDDYLQLKTSRGELERVRRRAARTRRRARRDRAMGRRPRQEHGAEQAVLICRDNQRRERLNHAARELLAEQGELGESIEIAGHEWAVGDRVIARRNDRGRDLDNGMRGTDHRRRRATGADCPDRRRRAPPARPRVRRPAPRARLRAHRPRHARRHRGMGRRDRSGRGLHPQLVLHRPLPRPCTHPHPADRRAHPERSRSVRRSPPPTPTATRRTARPARRADARTRRRGPRARTTRPRRSARTAQPRTSTSTSKPTSSPRPANPRRARPATPPQRRHPGSYSAEPPSRPSLLQELAEVRRELAELRDALENPAIENARQIAATRATIAAIQTESQRDSKPRGWRDRGAHQLRASQRDRQLTDLADANTTPPARPGPRRDPGRGRAAPARPKPTAAPRRGATRTSDHRRTRPPHDMARGDARTRTRAAASAPTMGEDRSTDRLTPDPQRRHRSHRAPASAPGRPRAQARDHRHPHRAGARPPQPRVTNKDTKSPDRKPLRPLEHGRSAGSNRSADETAVVRASPASNPPVGNKQLHAIEPRPCRRALASLQGSLAGTGWQTASRGRLPPGSPPASNGCRVVANSIASAPTYVWITAISVGWLRYGVSKVRMVVPSAARNVSV